MGGDGRAGSSSRFDASAWRKRDETRVREGESKIEERGIELMVPAGRGREA